jgi:acetoin utilization deacetylase AcuC-like enzyme
MAATTGAAGTGLVYHDRYLQHNTGLAAIGNPPASYPYADPEPHVSSPRTVGRAKHLLDLSGLGEQLTPIAARYASDDELAAIHTRDYIARVRHLAAAGGGDAGVNAPLGPDGFAIAALAAGGATAAVDAVIGGTVRNAYALVRPPGHHAVADRGLGFCIFNNIAIAARHAQRAHGLRRVAIVDWDVHDGNGTHEAFYDDGDVLFISLHQEGLFPVDMGLVEQTGRGAGEGRTVNIPLPPGSGDAAYAAAFARIVAPVVRQFAPELLLISCGLDASAFDPLGRMNLSTDAFRMMTRFALDLADECCGGRLVVIHEGGYSQTYVPACTLAVIETLAGVSAPWPDPAVARLRTARTAREVGLDAERALAAVIDRQRIYWTF